MFATESLPKKNNETSKLKNKVQQDVLPLLTHGPSSSCELTAAVPALGAGSLHLPPRSD